MELTVHNIPFVFSPDELARFLGYEGFNSVPKPANEQGGQATKVEVFQAMLGDDTAILDGAYMLSLTTLEQKVMDMDSGWKKEIAAVQEAMRKAATNADLFALTQQVVHIEEHLSQFRDVLKITDDDDDDL
ncbi:hypothetical protein CJ030_MR0G000129 [Morella rubra]|uniref:Uncharacterized protein n=1 Tax=Morella rubra TaxID=262757 RepID=A0A6A1UNF2_9ROSI|nr:hypothetical protein CJ030_MR0G000129 [Morella rubra]